MANELNAHAKPPAKIREVYKRFQKAKPFELGSHPSVLQFDANTNTRKGIDQRRQCARLPTELRQVFCDFLKTEDGHEPSLSVEEKEIYEVAEIPGLLIYPSFFPREIQLSLLEKLLHRDLSNPQHQTNIHLHYNVLYPPENKSFFAAAARDLLFQPKDPSIHKPLTTPQLLSKKLRWATLGGQYDWTHKVYPTTARPAFPSDVKNLIEGSFPMRAEAAIVNLYSPGDTLSLHRDVSEECDRPLVSVSLGCDAIFICGLDDERVVALRLRSGDAVLMSGESRYAWHGVPRVLEGSCPEWMVEWPGDQHEDWKGWMRGKRINLNVRQMFAKTATEG
ncbi:oxidoreductase [Lecanosticta acicola]|uniref:mRNA N(6)-methyladenine demethylase n=1 Tax=Lecanosticta acicola TaxID=111012 RepID=A0AAI8Z9L0_9PEZI|nr:oxidoreductase [Lecanosticta acicola]